FDWLTQQAALPPVLVMTSANPHGEPLCLGNREALSRLGHLADAWLLHDRDILTRVDDSVLAVRPGYTDTEQGHASASGTAVEPFFYRRARGYVPRPVCLPDSVPTAQEERPCVLGAGAELKAAICLARGQEAFVGQHVGDLENPATLAFYEESICRLESLLDMTPKAIVCDLHPDFLSSRYAEARAAEEGLCLWRLQHHAAHAAAVLAENACFSPALALCLDGTGLGPDGSIWGGELLMMDLSRPHWQRLGHLAPFALPGGEAAIREPWRIALALQIASGAETPDHLRPWAIEYGQAEAAVRVMLERGLNCPLTSSCGRLFDAVAAQLGLCSAISYEGQAAILLETAALPYLDKASAWPLPLRQTDGLLEVDSTALFAAVLQAMNKGESIGLTAARFHVTLADALAEMAASAARQTGLYQTGLSGGVMQNSIMTELLPRALRERGIKALTHHELPPGDGGLSLGQAVWGQMMLQSAAHQG
ncbi:MAG: Sua5/YciO/YrdC/YwlC family protein, partial [Desulfovibrionaceae bacterium]|nr:Sua5/YciO/YrdC/YwlC family protein [Desulfovibrionaceae bacterium]